MALDPNDKALLALVEKAVGRTRGKLGRAFPDADAEDIRQEVWFECARLADEWDPDTAVSLAEFLGATADGAALRAANQIIHGDPHDTDGRFGVKLSVDVMPEAIGGTLPSPEATLETTDRGRAVQARLTQLKRRGRTPREKEDSRIGVEAAFHDLSTRETQKMFGCSMARAKRVKLAALAVMAEDPILATIAGVALTKAEPPRAKAPLPILVVEAPTAPVVEEPEVIYDSGEVLPLAAAAPEQPGLAAQAPSTPLRVPVERWLVPRSFAPRPLVGTVTHLQTLAVWPIHRTATGPPARAPATG